ncbi:MAG TPA: AsmA-like C-terminal region-containing protein [bacterium]|nr:AsmA-like C-terminal region-containing protein [bacterium]
MTAPKRVPRWVIIGGAALLMLVVVLLLVPFLVPVDRFRPLIVRLAEDSTGRKIDIDALQLHLLPTIHLRVVNLHIKNPEGFPSGDTLVVKSLDVGTTLSSVLARRLDVTRVAFSGVEVNLLQTPKGKTNYDFSGRLGKPVATNAPEKANAPAFSLSRIDSVTARGVKITSGTYNPATRRVVPLFAADGLNARVGSINLGAQNWTDSVDVVGDLGGILFSNPALTKPLRIQKGIFRVKKGAVEGAFAAALDTLRVDGVVKIADIKNPIAEFDVIFPELDVDKLEALARAGGGGTPPPPPGGPRRLLARGNIKVGKVIARPVEAGAMTARLTIYTDRAEVTPYSLAAFGGTVRGTAVIDYAAARQPLEISAHAKGLDVGAVMKAAGRAQQGIAGKLDADVRATTALVPDPLTALKVTVDSYTLAASEGVIRGTAAVDYGAPGQPVQVTALARGVNLGRVMTTFAPSMLPGIGGTVDVDARVATRLRQDPLVALTAAGTFALRNGVLPGLPKPLEVQKGTFNFSGGGVQGTFAASLDTLRAQGAVAVPNLKNPVADFDVTVPDLDVDRVRTLFASGPGVTGKGGTAPGGRGGLRRLLAKGVLKVGRMRARPLEASAVTGRMNVFTDAVVVNPLSMSMYGGTARGAMTVDYTAPHLPLQAVVQVGGVDFSRVMAALAPGSKRSITGTLEGSGSLATILAADPLAGLTGTGTFAVRNGTITGLDVKNTLVSVAKVAEFVSSGITKFRYFGGDFRIQQQRVYSNALKLDSEGLQATGQGSSGFDRTLNYTGIGDVKTSVFGQPQTQLGLALLRNALGGKVPESVRDFNARVPFAIKGTFDNPQFSTTGAPQITPLNSPTKPQPQQPGQNPPQIPGFPQLPVNLPPLPFPKGP